ncbi:tigger transposable element-derived protein 1 [Trichonephila clavipes]|nr:tigger transposable element-derived protein 1 [Trichonephila clavipes]
MKQSEPSTSTSQAGKEFSASKGWLTGFLKRNALHNIKITVERATADEGAAKIFPVELAKIIEDGDYSANQIFNADETGLYWKKLPNRTYIAKDEKTASGHKAKNESLTVKDVWKQFSIFDCLIHVASDSAQIRPRTLNACWKKVWPACVTDNTTTQTSTLSDEIINLAHEIGGDGFNTFSHDDIDELLVDDALSDNDIIDLTLDLTVDGVVGLEGDNDEEEKSTPLTGKLIQEGLQLYIKLENHFLINDPNSERASKLQRELQNCMSGYRELYKKIKESSSQSLITDYIVRKGRATQNENEVCENPWPLPQISIAETVSSDDEGANAKLKRLYKLVINPDPELAGFLVNENINWKFLPPRAPNFGGLWEAGVKSFKFHFKHEAGNSRFTYEEFLTIMTQIEGILNSRPLTPLSTDIDDLSVLTPAHFLIRRPITSISEPNIIHIETNRLNIYERLTKIVQSIWKRWSNNYLSNLQQRSKWKFEKDNARVGDLVLIKEDNLAVNKWLMGRLIKVFPGKDNRIRVVTIKTQYGVVKRPISKICILPLRE